MSIWKSSREGIDIRWNHLRSDALSESADDPSFLRRLPFVQRQCRTIRCIQNAARLIEKSSPGRRQAYTSAVAREQIRLEFGLQCLDLPAQGGLSNVEA